MPEKPELRKFVQSKNNRMELMAQQLNSADVFPEYLVKSVDGRTLRIPQDLSGEYSVILFYRGGW